MDVGARNIWHCSKKVGHRSVSGRRKATCGDGRRGSSWWFVFVSVMPLMYEYAGKGKHFVYATIFFC